MVRKCFSYASGDMVRSTLLDCWFLVASYGQTTHFQPDLKSWPLNKNNFSSWTDRVDPRNVFLKEHWHYTHPIFCTYRYLFTSEVFSGKVPFWISRFWPPGGPKMQNFGKSQNITKSTYETTNGQEMLWLCLRGHGAKHSPWLLGLSGVIWLNDPFPTWPQKLTFEHK